MGTSMRRASGTWLNWGSSRATDRDRRRRSRRKTNAMRRLEFLEDRTLLNASIDIDADGLLTYTTDGVTAEVLNISVSGGIYTFNSNVIIEVNTNDPPLPTTGHGSNTVTVDGVTGLIVNAIGDNDDVSVFSTTVDTEINLNADDATVTLGDSSDPAGLGALTESITVTTAATASNSTLFIDDTGSTADTIHTLTSTTFTADNGFGGLTYSGVESVNIATAGGSDDTRLNSLPAGAHVTLFQGPGDDFASVSVPGASTAAGVTLHGGLGDNELTIDAGGLNIGVSNFSLGAGAATVVSGSPLGSPIVYRDYQRVTVNNLPAASAPDVTALPIDAVQGQRLIDVAVGTFTTTIAGATADNFSATIDWGDGSDPTGGWILQDAVDPSKFHVMGSHTYLDNAPTHATTITVAGVGSTSSTEIINGVPVTFVSAAAGSATDTGTANVTITELTPVLPIVTGSTINAVQGQRLVDAAVGSFTSDARGAKAGDFGATIDWGDGSAATAGVIVQDSSNPYVFHVYGTHTYWENSASTGYTTTISVTSSGSTSTEMINGQPVTFITPASGESSASGEAIVANAPIDLTVSSFSGFENITPSPSTVVVATFVDHGGVNPNVADPVSRYVATIDWGDGSGVSTIPTSAITQNANTNSYNITLPQRVYSTPGTYVVTVTVSDGGRPGANDPVTATATGVAHVMDAPLTAASPQPAITDATEGVLFTDRVLASFTDANPLATVDEYAVTIDWGDGSPLSHGKVIQPGGTGTPFFVVGTHSYANAQRSTNRPTGTSPVSGPVTTDGNYPIRIFVQDTYGSAVNLFNTIKVLDKAVTVTGRLNPASDSGISNSDAITNVQQPNFQGTASEAGALVFLYATPFGGTPTLIGQTTADANGAWSITSNTALADGGYEIQAQAYDASGNSISALTAITPNLVIDTVGPKITDVYLDNFNGQVIFTIEDLGGVNNAGTGVVLASLMDANNYQFSMIYSPVKGYRGAPQWLVTAVDVQPGDNVGEQLVTVQINDGQPIRGGHYSFNILSADVLNQSGVRDIADNAMDGEFYSFFPSGNNVRGGNFMTRLDAVHEFNYAPKTLVGPGSPVTPPGRPGQTTIVGRNIPRPRAALAAAMAARQANRPGQALAANQANRPGQALAPRPVGRPGMLMADAVRPRLAALRAR